MLVVTAEGSLSTLWVSLCFSTTLGSSGTWAGEGDRSYVADTAQEAGMEDSLGTTAEIVFVLASALTLLSFDDPIIKLESLFSNKSSVFKFPAAPGNGGSWTALVRSLVMEALVVLETESGCLQTSPPFSSDSQRNFSFLSLNQEKIQDYLAPHAQSQYLSWHKLKGFVFVFYFALFALSVGSGHH